LGLLGAEVEQDDNSKEATLTPKANNTHEDEASVEAENTDNSIGSTVNSFAFQMSTTEENLPHTGRIDIQDNNGRKGQKGGRRLLG
jgi:hypothetical protein